MIKYFFNIQEDIKEWRAVFFISAIIYFGTNLFFIVFGTSQKQSWNEPINITGICEFFFSNNPINIKYILLITNYNFYRF